jgi:hypothetical protein
MLSGLSIDLETRDRVGYGHYRNGILLTPATAHLVASQILKAGKGTQASAPAPSQTNICGELTNDLARF